MGRKQPACAAADDERSSECSEYLPFLLFINPKLFQFSIKSQV